MNTVKLDKEKLNALRKKLNTTFTAMSRKIGRSDSFISKCIGLGYMNENAFAHMCYKMAEQKSLSGKLNNERRVYPCSK